MTMPREQFDLARECVRFSALAYTTASIVDAATSTEVIIGGCTGDPETLIVAFRGSKEPRDFIMDAKFILKRDWPESAGAVHRGFADGVMAVMARVVTRVAGAARIICTGHSLGGARAILCAEFLRTAGFPLTNVITFGAPRVGNAAFRDHYNDELHDDTLRFEAQGDPVPWTPPWLLHGYRHVGRSAYLKDDGTLKVDPALWEHAPAFLAQAGRVTSSERSNLLGIFNPHHIANYERLLANVKEVRA